MTTAPRRFLLDANVFIQAKRQYYAFDIAPGFWVTLAKLAKAQLILSIDRVKSEIDRGKDDLTIWVDTMLPATFFPRTDEAAVIAAFGEAQTWVAKSDFTPAAKAEFATVADGWLPSYAREHALVVVTQEERNPLMRKKVPLPGVCDALGVECINVFQMLRELGVSLTT